MIDFYKFHGTSNDFIMIDNRKGDFRLDKKEIAVKWCDRRTGIGSDGIIFIETLPEVDYKMDFYNPDGSQSFCGNGSRCAFAFAKLLKIVDKNAKFLAIDGVHEANFENDLFHIHMNDVAGVETIGKDYFIHTGSPHYISYCESNDRRDILSFGKEIRFSERFKAVGTNVNLIEEKGAEVIDLRTYERGVEAETFACGTGATAAALSLAYKNGLDKGMIQVNVKGGELKVSFERQDDNFKNVWLIGPAEFVFKGVING